MSILSDHKQTEQVTDEEFMTLRQLLKLIRHERQWVNEFVSSLSYLAKRDKELDAAHVGGQLLQAWQNDPLNRDSHPGVLHCIGEAAGPIESAWVEISDRKFQELRNYLAVVRDGGWLAPSISRKRSGVR